MAINGNPGGALIKIIYGDLHPRKWKSPKSIKLFCLLPKSIIIFNGENPEISQNYQKTKVIYWNPNMHYNLQFCKSSVTCQIKAKHTSAVKW